MGCLKGRERCAYVGSPCSCGVLASWTSSSVERAQLWNKESQWSSYCQGISFKERVILKWPTLRQSDLPLRCGAPALWDKTDTAQINLRRRLRLHRWKLSNKRSLDNAWRLGNARCLDDARCLAFYNWLNNGLCNIKRILRTLWKVPRVFIFSLTRQLGEEVHKLVVPGLIETSKATFKEELSGSTYGFIETKKV